MNRKKLFRALGVIVVAGMAVIALFVKNPNSITITPETDMANMNSPHMEGLPEISMADANSGTEGMGFEGLLAYDSEDLVNGNPWKSGMEVESLPVYTNGAYGGEYAFPQQVWSEETMREKATDIAGKLGITLEEMKAETMEEQFGDSDYGVAPDEIYRLIATGDDVEIEIMGNGGIDIEFAGDGIALPKEYQFSSMNMSVKEAEKTLSYLQQQYSSVIHMEKPAQDISTEWNIYGDLNTHCNLYEGSGDIADQILSYNLRNMSFYSNDLGNLWIIRFNDLLAGAEKIGEYPLITEEDAWTLIKAGKYITSVPYDMPGAEYIKKVELVYKGGFTAKTIMPYYRFYVELPENEEFNPPTAEGLHDYGMYYVPAVEPQYLLDF